jgi:hypothetical protein
MGSKRVVNDLKPGSLNSEMVADWSHLISNRFGGRQVGGVVEAIKGNIWAVQVFTGPVVFSPQRQGSKDGARGSLRRKMIYPFAC